METVVRAEKRFGFVEMGSSKKSSKKKSRKHKKKKKSDEDSSDDSDLDSDSGDSLDSDEKDTDSSDSDSDDDGDKKSKQKKKAKDKLKKKDKEKSVEKVVQKKLKELGVVKQAAVAPVKLPQCEICDKGHKTKNCWYNPKNRGMIPERGQQGVNIVNIVDAEADIIFSEQVNPKRGFNNQGWQGNQYSYQGWRPQYNARRPPFRGNFNSGGRYRYGGYQNFRPPWNQGYGQQAGGQQQNWQPPQQWNQQQPIQQPQVPQFCQHLKDL